MPDSRPRVCLVTTGQPSTNPRLVKEADALSSAGYAVEVVGASAGAWAIDADRLLLPGRSWNFELVDWRRDAGGWLFWKSRLRQHISLRLSRLPRAPMRCVEYALTRPAPELARAAMAHRADLYIAHNLGALPAAVRAARRHGAKVAFDAEDFHSGQFPSESLDPLCRVVRRVERHYLPACDAITASAPGIADAYQPLSRVGPPQCLLNVGCLGDRQGAQPVTTSSLTPLTLYWFSQTIGPDRGLEDAVRAMGSVGNACIELHLRGTWAAGYQAVLGEVARRAGVGLERIHAHAPAAPHDMVSLASQFDVGLAVEPGCTVNNDLAISNKIFTYLLAGTAVIATRTAGQEWIMRQTPDAGWTYHPGDHAHLADILRGLVASRAQLTAARRAAWDHATRTFNWELERTKFLAVVERVLQVRPATRVASSTAPACETVGTTA
ncbi:MAG: hypothetical protein ABI051_05555 [Vicinamibacterales bacterium]